MHLPPQRPPYYGNTMPKLRPGGIRDQQLAARRKKAFEMKADDYSLRQIQEVTGIDKGDLSRMFTTYHEEALKLRGQELFDRQDERALDIYRKAMDNLRQVVPELDSDGNIILQPLLDALGVPVLDENGQYVMCARLDHNVYRINLELVMKAWQNINQLHGCNAPTKTASSITQLGSELPTEIVWTIKDPNKPDSEPVVIEQQAIENNGSSTNWEQTK